MSYRAVAVLVLFMLSTSAMHAQTLLSEFTTAGSTTGWGGAWLRFQTDATLNIGLHSVELDLENGGAAIGEVRLELYSARAGGSTCGPLFSRLLETSDTVTVPVGRGFVAFNFTGRQLQPNTEYFIALRDDSFDGADQGIYFDSDPAFPNGGAGNNCGQLNHRIYTQAAAAIGSSVAVPILSPWLLMTLASLVLLVAGRRLHRR